MIHLKRSLVKKGIFFLAGISLGLVILTAGAFFIFSRQYQDRIYPGVFIGNLPVYGKTQKQAEEALKKINIPFKNLKLTLKFEDEVATLSGEQLNLGFDSKLSSRQAFLLGRSGNFLSDTLFKLRSFFCQVSSLNCQKVKLSPSLTYKVEVIKETLETLSSHINIKPQEPLFEFNPQSNKVSAFRLGKPGRRLDKEKAEQMLKHSLALKSLQNLPSQKEITLNLPVKTIQPKVTAAEAEKLGVVKLLGRGVSYFKGSASPRIHNITLASSILHGQLIPPGEVFSFNKAVGDISAATGYKSAYIIKNDRTVLGDGGGVCQVSTTLFRAILDAGLPIMERHPHSYRVAYYEQGGFKPGLDATVFAPSIDLKFKNDTPGYLLIQAERNLAQAKLTFTLYGTDDGRSAQVLNHKVWDEQKPPPSLYQDDPSLPAGVTKQVEWEAWGAKASFEYKVSKNGQVIFEKTFYSNFRPWQAVFLRGN